MTMFLPWRDPDPGRCLNHRTTGADTNALPLSVRCLDYEGHEGRCRFPEPPKQTTTMMSASQSYVSVMPEPKPWVSPLDG